MSNPDDDGFWEEFKMCLVALILAAIIFGIMLLTV
jgi:hypothetical protein